MQSRQIIQFILLTICVCAIANCSRLGGIKTLKLAHGLNIDHPVHKVMENTIIEKSILVNGE